MADAEQFSLRWNNFHSNLSEGFHSLLEEVDLVDVTLAAEGQYLQAHKIVLSVCSPYFKQLFKANPCKHPIVILKDVCHKDLEALLQFMYQGEVNVRQEELAPFLKTAEMLQIKGLTGNDSKSSVPESPSQTQAQSPPLHRLAREPVIQQDSQNTTETSRPFKRQRTESPLMITGTLSSSSSASHSAPAASTVPSSQPPSVSPSEPPNVEFVPISNPKLEPLEYDNEADDAKDSPADLVQLLHSSESSQPPSDLPPAPPVLFNPVAGLPQDSGGSQDSMQAGEHHFTCPHCEKSFQFSDSLKKHIANIHGENQGPFICHLCHRIMKNKNSMNTHLYNYHSGKGRRRQKLVENTSSAHGASAGVLLTAMSDVHTAQGCSHTTPI